jgi:tetratricopeptide (TPR) repeat protein
MGKPELPLAAIAVLLIAGTVTPAAGQFRVDRAAQARRDADAGLAALRDGDPDGAVTLLRQAHAADPSNAPIANDLGYALGKRGERREAERLLRRAMELDPRWSHVYLNFADLLAEDPARWQRRDEIVAVLERGLEAVAADEAGQARVTLALVVFERSVGRLASARRRLAELLDREPGGPRPGSPGPVEVPPAVRKRAVDLATQIAGDERTRALQDWPVTSLGMADQATVKRAQQAVDGGEPERALALLAALVARLPGAVEARFVRAQALEALGRLDRAEQELAIILQLRPSHAAAWRRLGILLAVHGGTLDAERADEALRHALALEPSWQDVREQREKVAAKRPPAAAAPAAPATPPPSARARKLLDEAHQAWAAGGADELVERLAAQALAESPAYVDAAVTYHAFTGTVPETTVRALWADADALTRLAAQAQVYRPGTAVVARCLERAVALGSHDARWWRADLRAATGDRGGALTDLIEYVAGEPNPPHIDEARALRAMLMARPETADPAAEQALLALLADRPREAERLLGGPCRRELPPARLVELGRVHEYAGAAAPALDCYQLALETTGRGGAGDAAAGHAALVRLAAAAARAPVERLGALEGPLRQARRAQVPAAAWALARLEMQRKRPEMALVQIDAFLATAPPDDPARPLALSARASLSESDTALQRRRATRALVAVAALAAATLALLAWGTVRRLRGTSVSRALARRPALFPELSRAVAELRHDVLKHRASVLGMADLPRTRRQDVARALLEPRPASAVVAEIYERVAQTARGLGLTLRPLEREPAFGPVARDLQRAEAALRGESDAPLAELDRALREEHGPRLARLLTLGPRTALDAARVTGWIRAVEAEHGGPLGAGLILRDMDAQVAVDEAALFTVVANLLRNAAAAVAGTSGARLLVRIEREADVTGRQLVTVLVADSAAGTPTLAEIEQRDGQRGLGLVRDLTRRWGGHLVVRAEAAPLVKAIGACFPAAAAPA